MRMRLLSLVPITLMALALTACPDDAVLDPDPIEPDRDITKGVLMLTTRDATSSIEEGAASGPFWGCWPPNRDVEAANSGAIGVFNVTPDPVHSTVRQLAGSCTSVAGSTGTLTGTISYVTNTVAFMLTIRSTFNTDITETVFGNAEFDETRSVGGVANWTISCTNAHGYLCYKFGYAPTSIQTSGTVPFRITFSQ